MERKEEYQEIKQHGSRLFPFNIYPCTIPRDFATVALHWHRSMEVIYIKKGVGQVQLGMEVTEAKEGDIFVVPPGTLHALRRMRNYEMEYENIIFSMDFLGSGAADVCAQNYLVPLAAGHILEPVRIEKKEKDYSLVEQCLQMAEQLCEKPDRGYELAVKGAMLQMIYYLIRRNPEEVKTITPDTERLKYVLQRVEQDYREELMIRDIAQDCGCSASHFMRWFRKMTGISFTSYLNERRLAAAAEALRTSDDKILTISQNVGFMNLSNFNRQFRARYGITPREYRDN